MSTTTLAVSPRREYGIIALVGFAHGVSHFFHLLLPPLFPWLMPEFGLSFTEAGALMTVFFVISGTGQAAAGFVVDRLGPRRVLLGGMLSFLAAALMLALAHHYSGLVLAAALAGLGNSVFHPADFTLLNRKVTGPRLAHAFSVHGLSGNLGWAAAPALLTAVATLAGWRSAALAAALVAGAAWLVLWLSAEAAHTEPHPEAPAHAGAPRRSHFAFLGSLPVWMCFGFFFLVTSAFGALQNFAVPLTQKLYGVSLGAAASALSAFLLGGACGIVLGGALANRSQHHERLIAFGLVATAGGAFLLASGLPPAWSVLPLMALMGFLSGIAGPSRDLLVRRAATARFGQSAFGRVYGFVYSGLDTGLAVAPLIFGPLMDSGHYASVWVGVGTLYLCAVATALGVGQRIGAQRA